MVTFGRRSPGVDGGHYVLQAHPLAYSRMPVPRGDRVCRARPAELWAAYRRRPLDQAGERTCGESAGCALELELAAQMLEQPGAAAEQDRSRMDLDLVHQAGGKALLSRAGAVYGDHLAPCRRLRLLHRAVDAVGDKVKTVGARTVSGAGGLWVSTKYGAGPAGPPSVHPPSPSARS
jgi:hypothetical protein